LSELEFQFLRDELARLNRRLLHLIRRLDQQTKTIGARLEKLASAGTVIGTKEMPDEDYTVHEFDLTTARDNEEVYDKRLWHSITVLRADSDFEFKLNTKAAKPIPVKKDQTLTITHKIERF